MIVEDNKRNIQSNGNFETTEFRIANTSKMFKMLTDSLYSNKIESIVRELSSNAYDSHVEADRLDKPFEVECPTYSNKLFSIRDFGNGLSPEKIKELYTVLGVSDKTQSNEYIGCLGIGSKSPFCYSDNFTVTSWNGGYKRIYSCYLNEDGIPCISLLSENKSNEPNGMKIDIAVKYEDITDWSESIRKNYIFYKIQPKCNIVLNKLEVKPTNIAGFDIYNLLVGEGLYILMGNSYYQVNKCFDVKFKLKYREGLIFRVPIGSVSVDISRENLQYDQKTNSYLRNMFSSIKDEILSKNQMAIDKCKSKLEAVNCIDYSVIIEDFEKDLIYKPTKENILTIKQKIFSTCNNLQLDKIKAKIFSRDVKKINSLFLFNEKFIVDDIGISTYNILNQSNYKIIIKFERNKEKFEENLKILIEEIEKTGYKKEEIIFTSQICKKTKNNGVGSKIYLFKSNYYDAYELEETKDLPTSKDYYILRNNKTVATSMLDRKLFKKVNLKLFALTETQAKKFGCKQVDFKQLSIDYLNSLGINKIISAPKFNLLDLVKVLNITELDSFIKDYKIKQEEYSKFSRILNQKLDYSLHCILSNVNDKEENDFDKLIVDKYPKINVFEKTSLEVIKQHKQDIVNFIKIGS